MAKKMDVRRFGMKVDKCTLKAVGKTAIKWGFGQCGKKTVKKNGMEIVKMEKWFCSKERGFNKFRKFGVGFLLHRTVNKIVA